MQDPFTQLQELLDSYLYAMNVDVPNVMYLMNVDVPGNPRTYISV